MNLSLLFPIGVLIAGAKSKTWVRISGDTEASPHSLQVRWQPLTSSVRAPDEGIRHVLATFAGPGVDVEVALDAPASPGEYVLEFWVSNPVSDASLSALRIAATVISPDETPVHLTTDVRPLSYAWGVDRGLPVHRLHLEQFLAAHAADMRGRCLEFQEPRYVPRFGGSQVGSLDILHVDATNPKATVVADLTQPNDIDTGRFDCIVCTHVLQSIFDVHRAIAELHRILAPGGVLLVAEPQISMCDRRYDELWRFTTDGLTRLLTSVFDSAEVQVHSFGNSLTAAGEMRGLVAAEYPAHVLAQHDPRFATEICARAVKV